MRKLSVVLTLLGLCCACTPKTVYLSFVDPMVGTIRPGETMPAVEVPFGMNSWTPETLPDESKGHCPYYYVHDRLYGIRASHWMSGSATQDYGSFTVMPLYGPVPGDKYDRSARFRHENEISRPDYYSVVLDNGIRIEVTGTSRAGILRVTWPEDGQGCLILMPNSDEAVGSVSVDTVVPSNWSTHKSLTSTLSSDWSMNPALDKGVPDGIGPAEMLREASIS